MQFVIFYYIIEKKKKAKEKFMKKTIEQSLEAVHIHTHTSDFIKEINILPYVLFGMHIRDG